MKIFSLFYLAILISLSCSSQKQKELDNAVFEYTANTRGFYQKISIENKIATVSNDRSGIEKPIKITILDADWQKLKELFQKTNLEELKNYKDPTQKRFYDGAAIAHLKIKFKEKDYESKAFDHGFPPKEIKKIVEIINSFAKQDNDN